MRPNSAVAQPTTAAEIMLPPGVSFIDAAAYVKVIATQQLTAGGPAITVHVCVTANKRLTTPVVVMVEDQPHVDRVQVRPYRQPARSTEGFLIVP